MFLDGNSMGAVEFSPDTWGGYPVTTSKFRGDERRHLQGIYGAGLYGDSGTYEDVVETKRGYRA